MWTEQQEAEFQSMLKLRQAATAAVIAAANEDFIESIQHGLFEDVDEVDAWESFINFESPFVVADMCEQIEGSK